MRDKAVELIQRLPPGAIVLPVRILGELFNVLVRKVRRRPGRARAAVLSWRDAYPTVETSGSLMGQRNGSGVRSWASDLGLSCAGRVGKAECRLLLSEDLQEGFTWRGVTVTNAFAPTRQPLLAALLTALEE